MNKHKWQFAFRLTCSTVSIPSNRSIQLFRPGCSLPLISSTSWIVSLPKTSCLNHLLPGCKDTNLTSETKRDKESKFKKKNLGQFSNHDTLENRNSGKSVLGFTQISPWSPWTPDKYPTSTNSDSLLPVSIISSVAELALKNNHKRLQQVERIHTSSHPLTSHAKFSVPQSHQLYGSYLNPWNDQMT